ncbi:MAG: rod shape-determining protein RodA [Salinivirgaceae bacterium]|jgi:rod shape determining protein RodA|nr:rod shape-determining protein RodA [Salinivirgaceae bacterium]
MQDRKANIWQSIDWVTIGLYFLLVSLGWFNIYSAVYTGEQSEAFDFTARYGRQLIWIFASIIIMLIALVIDSKFYSSFSFVIYGVVIFLLIAVLIFGKTINGATSWFVIGPVRLQPSEFAKFATALALAKYLSAYNLKPEKIKTFIAFSAIAFLPLVLILLQKDAGSALVFFIFFLVYFREGMPSAYLLIGFLSITLFILSLIIDNYVIFLILEALAFIAFYLQVKNIKMTLYGALFLAIVTVVIWGASKLFDLPISKSNAILIGLAGSTVWYIGRLYKHKIREGYFILIVLFASVAFTFAVDSAFHKVFDDYQQQRIKVLLGIESDPYGAGYNVNQSMIAIGSGGAAGKGYLQGTQTKFKFVPEQSTDFIFCTVGEEWGFLGTSVILSLFLFLLLRLIYLAERQKSRFSRVFGYCVASIIFFHVAINVGMTIGLAPVIGIPLPFFSYGGSSLWGFTFLLFIFLKLDVNRTQLIN